MAGTSGIHNNDSDTKENLFIYFFVCFDIVTNRLFIRFQNFHITNLKVFLNLTHTS